ncbi:MAG TPA: SDR family NAD(P)-dependent oxidoreductase [Candidatus Sulfotelmatobacter sp.]|nr:SDR family NAD(P)-dependent oxidoreductase [Candidatus Sulfotelmatobacter sp.]
MRLKDKTAIVIGAGQSPGEGMGNGRATALRFAQEGARVMAVDNRLASAEDTAKMAREAGGDCVAAEADVTKEATLKAMIADAHARWGRIDILHYNVGVSLAGGDAPPLEITEEAFDRVTAINLRGAVMAVKHVLPIMRAQRSGVILTISSVAAWEDYPYVAYKATKAALVVFTKQVAIRNAEYGIRANTILPGLMDTPMAVDTRARTHGKTRAQVAAERDAKVALRGRMGTAWDVANAALFLASDEANFITGVELPVDGGALVRVGAYASLQYASRPARGARREPLARARRALKTVTVPSLHYGTRTYGRGTHGSGDHVRSALRRVESRRLWPADLRRHPDRRRRLQREPSARRSRGRAHDLVAALRPARRRAPDRARLRVRQWLP